MPLRAVQSTMSGVLQAMNTKYFKGKTLLITGGTGSFGNTVLKHFLHSDIGEIRIFFTR